MENIKEIGAICATWRKENNIPQQIIARDLGLSVESISAFEHGRTNNALILSWYIKNGLKL